METGMSFKIYAVGSSKSLAAEVKTAVEQLLSFAFPVEAIEIDSLYAQTNGDFYVCNRSLYNEVSKYVEEKRIAVSNLLPTASFYLKIREIPSGADIYILNNRSAYCKTLEELCRNMELREYRYIHVPYAELDRAERIYLLSKAHYIIGVQNIIDEFCQDPEFKEDICADTVIIKAQRVVSVSATGEIATKLNRLLLQDCRDVLSILDDQLQKLDDDYFLYEYYTEIIKTLRTLQNRFYVISNETLSRDNIIIRSGINQLHD